MRHAGTAPLVDFVQVAQFISARHRMSEKAFYCQGLGMSMTISAEWEQKVLDVIVLCGCARVMHSKLSFIMYDTHRRAASTCWEPDTL